MTDRDDAFHRASAPTQGRASVEGISPSRRRRNLSSPPILETPSNRHKTSNLSSNPKLPMNYLQLAKIESRSKHSRRTSIKKDLDFKVSEAKSKPKTSVLKTLQNFDGGGVLTDADRIQHPGRPPQLLRPSAPLQHRRPRPHPLHLRHP